MSNPLFSEAVRRILRDNPALDPDRTRELAGQFEAAQAEVCDVLAGLSYPLERVAQELAAGVLAYFREGSDRDGKNGGGKKAAYRFAGFAPSLMEEFAKAADAHRQGAMDGQAYRAWQSSFLRRFTFEVIEQVAVRVEPAPDGSAACGEVEAALSHARRIRDAILQGNLLLVAKVAVGRARFHAAYLIDDLFTAGTDGLLIAANRYDHRVGRFSTYAIPWITMAMDRHMAKTRHLIHIPIGVQDKARRSRRDDEARGLEHESLLPQVQSLEDPLPGCQAGEAVLAEVVADPDAERPERAVEMADIAQMLDEGVRKLDRLKQFVIAIRNDVGDAAALASILYREESALSLDRGRATATAALEAVEAAAAAPEAVPALAMAG